MVASNLPAHTICQVDARVTPDAPHGTVRALFTHTALQIIIVINLVSYIDHDPGLSMYASRSSLNLSQLIS